MSRLRSAAGRFLLSALAALYPYPGCINTALILKLDRKPSMISIEIQGLTEEHCESLAGAQVGDLLLIEAYPKAGESEYGDGSSEIESEGSQNEGEDAVAGGDGAAESLPGSGDEQEEEVAEDNVDAAGSEREDDRDDTPSVYLYQIQDISTNENGAITARTIRELDYCLTPAEATSSTYQIYGNKIKINNVKTISDATPTNEELLDIGEMFRDETYRYYLKLKPTGSDIRNIIFDRRCPASCNDGWVDSQETMHAMVKETMPIVSPYEAVCPVCPVCLGKSMMRRLQTLRENFDDLSSRPQRSHRLLPRSQSSPQVPELLFQAIR